MHLIAWQLTVFAAVVEILNYKCYKTAAKTEADYEIPATFSCHWMHESSFKVTRKNVWILSISSQILIVTVKKQERMEDWSWSSSVQSGRSSTAHGEAWLLVEQGNCWVADSLFSKHDFLMTHKVSPSWKHWSGGSIEFDKQLGVLKEAFMLLNWTSKT